jgi:hypothetical protein
VFWAVRYIPRDGLPFVRGLNGDNAYSGLRHAVALSKTDCSTSRARTSSSASDSGASAGPGPSPGPVPPPVPVPIAITNAAYPGADPNACDAAANGCA